MYISINKLIHNSVPFGSTVSGSPFIFPPPSQALLCQPTDLLPLTTGQNGHKLNKPILYLRHDNFLQQLHFSKKLYVERFLKIQYLNILQSSMGNCSLIRNGQQQQTLYLKISVHFCAHQEHNSEYLIFETLQKHTLMISVFLIQVLQVG